MFFSSTPPRIRSRGALQLLLDTGEMDNNTYNVWYKRLHDKVEEVERVKWL